MSSLAVITGASKGIGRATALRLAERYDILALARSKRELDALARTITAAGGRCEPLPLDVTDDAAVERELGRVDAEVLVNNAGIGIMKPLLELTRDEWRRMVDVNLNSLYTVTRAVLPRMVARRRGFVVNIASLAGRNPFAGGTCYAATKHAVLGFSESLMLEVRDAGVRVSAIMPGSVATDFFPPGRDTSWMLTSEQVAEAVWYVITQPESMMASRVELRPSMPKRST